MTVNTGVSGWPIYLLQEIRKVYCPREASANTNIEGKGNSQAEKWAFFLDAIDYSGHVNKQWKLEIALHITNAIKQLKFAHNAPELNSFLKLCNIISRFVPYFARVATRLSRELHKDRPRKFGPLNNKENPKPWKLFKWNWTHYPY